MQVKSIPKCVHGVYIVPNDTGLLVSEIVSENCEVCKYIYPDVLDHKFKSSPKLDNAKPKTLSGVYELWVSDKTNQVVYDWLFHGIRNYAMQIGREMFSGDKDVPEFRDAANDIALDMMNQLDQYDNKGFKFSTWLHKALVRDFMDWLRAYKARPDRISLDDPDHPIVEIVQPTQVQIVFVQELISKLNLEEQELWERKAFGESDESIAKDFGIPRRTLTWRWDQLRKKLKDLAK